LAQAGWRCSWRRVWKSQSSVYEFLEADRTKYAIRLPANRILQERIGHLLTHPSGRPPSEVRCSYAKFTYQAGSRTKPRVVAKVKWHPGEFYTRIGFRSLMHSPWCRPVVLLDQPPGIPDCMSRNLHQRIVPCEACLVSRGGKRIAECSPQISSQPFVSLRGYNRGCGR
jgi:DDE family transposase